MSYANFQRTILLCKVLKISNIKALKIDTFLSRFWYLFWTPYLKGLLVEFYATELRLFYAIELRLSMRHWRPCGLMDEDASGWIFWHGNPRLFQRHGFWLRIDITTALRGYGLLAQVHGLVCFVRRPMRSQPCLYFSTALRQIKLFPSRSKAVTFLKAVDFRA